MLQVSVSKFSQLSNSEVVFENLSTIERVTICNAMSSFLDHPVYSMLPPLTALH